jgi:Acetyl-CoA hydrolase
MIKSSELSMLYNTKLVSADRAVQIVKDNDRINYGMANGNPHELDEALAKRVPELKNIDICNTITMRRDYSATFRADMDGDRIRFTSSHFSGLDRKMNKQGKCWYSPIQFRETPKLWEENTRDIDVMMIQVTPMDKYGNFNLGPQVADNWGVISRAKKIIVEENEKMPFAHGNGVALNLSQVDYVVRGKNTDLIEIKAKKATEIEEKIASHVVERIQNGSTIQLGIGGLPNCVGSMICESDLKDLSIHTEMLVDACCELYEAGKVTGNKNLDKGKMVYSFAGGTKKLYDFIDNNQVLCAAPIDYVNSIDVISSNDRVVSINSCIQLDLFGQVCSESVGLQHISGTGGQLDFVLGAFQSEGGQSFICTPSVRLDKNGQLESLIRPLLQPGSIVTTPRSATHFIVTEYGLVNLKGKSTWDRAELLISIAHPSFQDVLIKEAECMGIWKNSSKII